MHTALNRLYDWSYKWQINISHQKCSILSVGRSSFDRTFSIGSSVVPNVTSVRDLVSLLIVTCPEHIGSVVAKAQAHAGLIHKCFLSRHVPTLVRAFTTYVRPLLEYCFSVCGRLTRRVT